MGELWHGDALAAPAESGFNGSVVERGDGIAATRTRIADAALAQVAAGGYASATVTAVAHRAGVAAGSVYTYFPSKAELFAEVFREANAGELALVAEIAARHADPVPHRLAPALDAGARRPPARPTLARAPLGRPGGPPRRPRGRAARSPAPRGPGRPGGSRSPPPSRPSGWPPSAAIATSSPRCSTRASRAARSSHSTRASSPAPSSAPCRRRCS